MNDEDIYSIAEMEPAHLECADCGAVFLSVEFYHDEQIGSEEDNEECPGCGGRVSLLGRD